MSLPALLLLVVTAVQVVGPLFAYPERLRRLTWMLIPALVGWQLWRDSLLPSMVPVYLLLVVMLLAFIYRGFRQRRGKPTRRRRWLRTLAVLLSLPLLAVPVLEATLVPFDPVDYRGESWTGAFDGLHMTLRQRYAFGEWKRIDWDGLYAEYYPAVAAAERSGDESAYYAALRTYVFNLPDGHVGIDGPVHNEAARAATGGGFGFAVLKLDDGRVIAHIVEGFGPAKQAGMAWGAEILEWDGKPVSEAARSVPTVWASRPPATVETLSLARHQLLTQAPVGAERTVTFRNPGETRARTLILEARDDGYRTYEKSVHWETVDSPAEAVHYRVLENTIGYIRIAALGPSPNVPNPVEEVGRAVQHMVDEDVQALILDVRGNRGGPDALVPQMMGYFTPARLHYEHITYYSHRVKNLRLLSLYVDPNELQFTKPVAVLVDHRTKSSGEGFGLIAQSLPNVTVVGIRGTDGSFGMASASVPMPAGIRVFYPWGQSLDQAWEVQVDSDHRLEGGVQPDVSVPLTLETAESIYLQGDDAALAFASQVLKERSSER